jgi:hypothetical protein
MAASDNTTHTTTDDTNISTTPIPLAGCYTWAVNNDTATMELKVAGNAVTGDLVYDWSEKDWNKGTLNGEVQDSLLVANYTFQSEGTTSVRKVVFKINGDSLYEGFGDVDSSGDTVKFKNDTQLQFQTDRSFKKVECPK